MEHQTRQHRADGMEAVLKGGHHAKVAPTATQPPEEVRVLSVAGDPELAIGSDDIDGDQVLESGEF
jgi:hypothetical protein